MSIYIIILKGKKPLTLNSKYDLIDTEIFGLRTFKKVIKTHPKKEDQ